MSEWGKFSTQVGREFGDILRSRRALLGLTQGELAERLGLQRTSITNMESGNQIPSLPYVIAIAQLFDIEPSVLIPRVQAPIAAGGTYSRKISDYQNIASEILRDVSSAG